ncbi:hypothetical protein GKZ68_04965 [Hymenobacter sp. BRD128]|uniref:hypothetical protein n=1 Tax=Hymenobacter sp. BRD128 TaxID=2675878 RepID=UPI0015669632|nr:hypothetical protein [Hymenobacter sp. BRD128]QKG56045.1 hypothetical protein GKZ68_04965 [Hymenobacter sp. BRD128]
MKRLLLPFLLGAAAWLAPSRSFAQEKPVLNTAPPGAAPAPVRPAPRPAVDTTNVAPTIPVYTPGQTPAPAPAGALPAPSPDSPSGLELPGREQERKAAQQHAEQYTKLFIYSGIGLGYSSYYGLSNFNFSVSPAIGYRVNDRFAIGPGISYAYNYYGQNNGNGTSSSVSTSSFGAKVFAQLRVIDQFFIHAEYESTKAQFLALDQYNHYVGIVTRQVQTPLAGVGYRSQISNRVAADIVLLYNFQDNYNSIYPNPVIRFNFLFNIGH